jgi:prevent-host-death family protein
VPEVGIRELRAKLSRYIDQVRAGEEITVTDHGRAVARITPLDRPRVIEQLIEEGLVTPAAARGRSTPRRVTSREPVSPLVSEQRR